MMSLHDQLNPNGQWGVVLLQYSSCGIYLKAARKNGNVFILTLYAFPDTINKNHLSIILVFRDIL